MLEAACRAISIDNTLEVLMEHEGVVKIRDRQHIGSVNVAREVVKMRDMCACVIFCGCATALGNSPTSYRLQHVYERVYRNRMHAE